MTSDSTQVVLLREQNAELVAAWEVFYQGLPDGEYAGLGEMRSTMRAIGWDMTAAEKRKKR